MLVVAHDRTGSGSRCAGSEDKTPDRGPAINRVLADIGRGWDLPPGSSGVATRDGNGDTWIARRRSDEDHGFPCITPPLALIVGIAHTAEQLPWPTQSICLCAPLRASCSCAYVCKLVIGRTRSRRMGCWRRLRPRNFWRLPRPVPAQQRSRDAPCRRQWIGTSWRVFHAVAEAGSFTHAGEALNLSQSAVSRQISALEGKPVGAAVPSPRARPDPHRARRSALSHGARGLLEARR